MTYKLAILLALILAVACGKKNASVTNKTILSGNGRSSRAGDDVLYSEKNGRPQYLISNYTLVEKPEVTLKDSNTKVTVGVYALMKLIILKPGATTTTATGDQLAASGPSANVAGGQVVASTNVASPPGQKAQIRPVTREYHYFIDMVATCSDGPNKTKTSLLERSYVTGETSFTKGTPMDFSDIGGQLSRIEKKNTVTIHRLSFTKPVGAIKVFDLLRRASSTSFESLKSSYQKGHMDYGRDKILQDVATACKNTLSGGFPPLMAPPDVADPSDNLQNQLNQYQQQLEQRGVTAKDLDSVGTRYF